MSSEAEARLRELLGAQDLPPAVALNELGNIPAEARDALVREVARTFHPPPPARLLARLPLIRTEANVPDMVAAFLANLGSPDPEGRKASLYGLDALGYPAIADVAVQALRDPADAVVAAACDLLARRGSDPERVRPLLEGVYRVYRDDPRFSLTRAVLEGSGIGNAPPAPEG